MRKDVLFDLSVLLRKRSLKLLFPPSFQDGALYPQFGKSIGGGAVEGKGWGEE